MTFNPRKAESRPRDFQKNREHRSNTAESGHCQRRGPRAGRGLLVEKGYQRGSRRGGRSPRSPRSPPRPPPPPPLPRRWPPPPPPPPGRPNPPPPPPPRSTFGRASLTFKRRPPNSLPLSAAMACSASSSSGISTNAKPRDRPVSRSVTILTLSTAPWTSKRARTSSSLALKARFPTKIFFTSSPLDLESELAGAGSRRQSSLGSCGLVWRAIKYPSSVAGSRARQDGPREGLRRLFLTAARTDPRASRRRGLM